VTIDESVELPCTVIIFGQYESPSFLVCSIDSFSSQIVTGLILTPVMNEFNVLGPWLKLAQMLGFLVGAAFWGAAADVWGRRYVTSGSLSLVLPLRAAYRWAFNITLGITGLFAIPAGGSLNYVALCSLTAAWSVGVGGNLSVDSAVFLGKSVLCSS
jgi:MFS family permease